MANAARTMGLSGLQNGEQKPNVAVGSEPMDVVKNENIMPQNQSFNQGFNFNQTLNNGNTNTLTVNQVRLISL